jgi:endonuclease/exonuclease/phosphatase family metal-dependent hydrolase
MLRELPSAGTGGTLGVLLGDFNATLDHRELRRVLDRGYVDAADATGEGFRTTWPAGRRFPPEIAIDHVLADRRIAARSLSVHLVPRSDHRAVIAVLELPRAAMG